MKVRMWRYAAVMLVCTLISAACASDDNADGDTAAEPVETEAVAEAEGESDPPVEAEPTEDAEPTEATEAAEPTEDAEPAENLEPIRALFATRYAVPSIGDIAEPLGYWDDLGLEVELLEGQEAVETLASGDVDIAVSSPNRFIGGILAGAEIEILGPTGLVWDQYIIVRSDLGITSLDEFEGGTYGISRIGSAGHYGSEKVAESLGWAEEDYDSVILGNLDGIRAALEAGQIDWFTWSAEGSLAVEDSGAAVILGNTADLIGPVAFNVIAASRDAIENRPESVRAFCEGYYEAQRFAKSNPEETAQIMIDEGGRDPNITLRVVEDGAQYLSDDDQMPEDGWETLVESTIFTIDGLEEGDLTADQVQEMYTPCSEI